MKWQRGDIAIYQGGMERADLTEGDSYVVNQAGSNTMGITYIQVVTDDRRVADLLADFFTFQCPRCGGSRKIIG